MTNEQEFRDMLYNYFIYDDTLNIYDHHHKPLFFSQFLQHPDKLSNFLKTISEIMPTLKDPGIIIFRGTNVITLLTCATFHLCKLHTLLSQQSPEIYVDILCQFYKDIKVDIDFNQNVENFFTPYTYFVLMVSTFIPTDKDLSAYLTRFNLTDPLNQLFKPLLDNDAVDIYHYPIKKNLQIKSLNKSVIVNANYDSSVLYNYVKTKLNYELTVDEFKIIGFLHQSFPYLYNSSATRILYNHKWETVMNIIWNLIEDSEDLQIDIYDIFYSLFEEKYVLIESELLFHRVENETILFPMMRNRHFDKNIGYIKKIFTAFLKRRWTNVPNANYLRHMLYKEYAFDIDDTRKDILTEILEFNFEKRNKDAHDLAGDPKHVLDDGSIHSLSISLNIVQSKKYKFKEIISHLLQYITGLLNEETDDDYIRHRKYTYYSQLYKYYDDLHDIDIDLDRYHLNDIILQTPPSVFKSRSFDAAIVTSSVNPFSKFHDKQLMTRLSQIYEKTVQHNSNNDDKDTGRIIKIQKYFTKKYKPLPAIYSIQNVVKGHELEYLYTFWMNVLKKGSLHVTYNISYMKEPGVDQGGITNYFFTMVSKQIKNLYFTQIEDSSRYILKNTVTADVANFVGQLLAIFISYNIHIPFSLSILYLGHMMFSLEQITYEELFLYYVLDLYKSSAAYYYRECEVPSYESSCDIQQIVKDVVPIRYNNNRRQFNRFLAGFFIHKKIFNIKFRSINDKIRIYDLDKVLSQSKLTQAALKNLCKRIVLQFDGSTIIKTDEKAKVYMFLEEILLADNYDDLYIKHKDHDVRQTLKSKEHFCKAILTFWTGAESIMVDQPYYIHIMSDINIIKSSTCANLLKLPLPVHIPTKQDLYSIFMRIFLLDDQHVFSTL